MVERHHAVVLTLLLYTWFVDADDNGSCIERASIKAVALFRAQDLSKCSLRTADDLTASVAAIVNLPRDMDKQYLRVRSLSQKEDAFLNYTKSLIDSVDKLVDQSSVSLWENLTESFRLSLAGQLLASVERSSFLLAINLHSRDSLPLERRNLVLKVVVVQAARNVTFSLPQVNLSLASPASKTHGGRNRVAFALYRDLSAILTVAGNATVGDPRSTATSSSLRSARDTHGDTDGVSVVSAVVSAALETSPSGGGGGGGGGGTTLAKVREGSTQLETPVVFTLRHSEAVSHPRVSVCAFWSPSSASWQTSGCVRLESTSLSTTCSCEHLTHFAILAAPVYTELESAHELSLSIITWLGLLLSCVCLLLSVATFCACRALQSDRTTLHKNLALCLLIANVVFLAGVGQTASKAGCALVAALLHFFFLAAFLWMLLEGVQLYVMLVQVFESSRSRRPYFYAIGYGVPALIVTATAASRPHGYGTERACWLSYENGVIWSFLAPVIIVITVNVGFLSLTLYKMVRHASHVKPVSGTTGNIRSWTLGCASLLCLLGLTWTFGLLFVNRGSLPLAYLFTILNSAQGIFIFTFHCLMQKKVRKEYARCLSRLCPSLARLGDSLTSTTTPNSTTASSLRSSTRGSSSTRGLLMRGSKVNFSKASDSDSSINHSTPAEQRT